MHSQMSNTEMEQCIANCLECHRTCEQTLTYCISKGGKHVEPKHVEDMRDCVQSCITSADFMIRNSEMVPRICDVCSQICTRCAVSCDQFGNDEKMSHCAQVCRRCAESCGKMAHMQMQI